MSNKTIVEIIAERSIPEPNSGCLLWTGWGDSWGYGRLRLPWDTSKVQGAHRAAYEARFGPIPDGLVVCHKCDTPPCVNTDHLFLDTPAGNRADCVAKGRQFRKHPDARARKKRPGHPLTGKAPPRTLKEEDVVAILARLASGGESKAAIARDYGVDRTSITGIANGKWWRSVPRG